MQTRVTIYTKDFCPYCIRAKAILEANNVPYFEVAGDTPENRAVMGGGTFPQVWIDGANIGGSDNLADLAALGGLKEYAR